MDKLRFGVHIQNATVASMFRIGTDSWGNAPPKPVASHDIGSICSGLVPFQVSGPMRTIFRSHIPVEITQVFIEGSYYPADHTIKFCDESKTCFKVLGECKIRGNGNTFQSSVISLSPPFQGAHWSIEEKSFNAQVTRRYWFHTQPVSSTRTTLKGLLDFPHYSDIRIHELCLHKAILGARCPLLVKDSAPDALCPDKQIFTLLIEFLYTNEILQSQNEETICKLLKTAKVTEFFDLENYCQRRLMDQLKKENAFHVLYLCAQHDLDQEIEWVCWFIGRHKVMVTPEDITRIGPVNPNALASAINESVNLKCLPPIHKVVITPIEDVLDKLFDNACHSDFPLNFGSYVFRLHSCILNRWKFFEVLKHGHSHEPNADIPHGTFQKLLRYLYCGKAETITFVDAGWILAMREYYLLDESCPLVSYCEAIISSQIGRENWLDAFVLGCQLGDSTLKKQAKSVAVSTSPDQIIACVSSLLENAKQLREENRMLRATIKKMETKENREKEL